MGGGGGGVPCRLSELASHSCRGLIGSFSTLTSLSEFCWERCLLSEFHFMCCRYLLGHVACRNLPCQGLEERFQAWFFDSALIEKVFKIA